MTVALVLGLLGCAGAIGVSCTNTYLYDERRDDQVPGDRTVTIEGDFCTPATNAVIRPIKILVAMDASISMGVTDPDGTRATAVVELIKSLPREKEIYLTVMLFAGSTTAYLTKSGLNKFESISTLTQADLDQLQQRILTFATTGNMANRDATDFVKPLSDIYSVINTDITDSRVAAGANADQTRARYSVIFLSDGQPTINQDLSLLCGDDVKRIRDLKDLAYDVQLNTVHVFLPTQAIDSSVCNFDGGITVPPKPAGSCAAYIPDLPPGACPLLLINQEADRLQVMATLGGGDFRDFRNNEPINFLSFNFGQVRRSFGFDKLIVTNFSSPPDSPLDGGDTDSDGLLDDDEINLYHTSPFLADTDGDGFSDGVEVYFSSRGAGFTPNQVATADGGGLDLGCPVELRGVDSDCDGLTDCDEDIIGTNKYRIDSDDDGVPDSVEWQLGTEPASKDLAEDPDSDGLQNGDELALHANPKVFDTQVLTSTGYRYEVRRDGGITPDGQQCYSFRVSNVALANTLPDTRDAGNPDGGDPLYRRGAGYNDLFISTSMVPGDDPAGRTLLNLYRYAGARYPVGGIKAPPDGIIRVHAGDFSTGCSRATSTATP